VQYLRASFPGICFVDQGGLSQRARHPRPRKSGVGVVFELPLPGRRRRRGGAGNCRRFASEVTQSDSLSPRSRACERVS
jgi:hypothetical protein